MTLGEGYHIYQSVSGSAYIIKTFLILRRILDGAAGFRRRLTDCFDRVGRSIDYIESRLDSDMDLTDVANAACCSLFYFHRVFQAMVGDTVKEYIRKRRLTEAARMLVGGDRRILDIALDFGYGSQEAFTRAFKAGYGLAPGEFRTGGLFYALRERKSAGQLHFDRSLRSGAMEPRIERRDAFTVVGRELITKIGGTNLKEIPLFWRKYLDESLYERIPDRKLPWAEYGVCSEPDDGTGDFVYMIGEEVTKTDAVPPDMKTRTIPEALYAVFTSTGPLPETLQKVTAYAYGTWLPGSGEWEWTESEDFELYDERCRLDPPLVELWIPVRKKPAADTMPAEPGRVPGS